MPVRIRTLARICACLLVLTLMLILLVGLGPRLLSLNSDQLALLGRISMGLMILWAQRGGHRRAAGQLVPGRGYSMHDRTRRKPRRTKRRPSGYPAMAKHVIGWKLDEAERRKLIAELPPRYPHVVADHVTLKSGVEPDKVPPGDTAGEIIGEADDGAGVQAMVIQIDGGTDRPGGGTFHITWSLDKDAGRKAKESNDVIAAQGWTRLQSPKRVTLIGARFPW